MSIDNQTSNQFPLSVDNLNNLYINGQTVDPTLLVPYLGSTSDLNLNNKNLTNVNNLSSKKLIINDYNFEDDSKDRLTISYNSSPYFYFKNDGRFESVSISSNTIESTVSLTSPIITTDQLTATSPSIYLINYIQYISSTQLLVRLSVADTFSVNDVLNIENNFYRGQVIYQSSLGPSTDAFYVSNGGYGNSGNKFGGSISLNKGIINSNITRNKQNVIDNLYTFKKDPSNSNLQLLYVNDSNLFYWTTGGRFKSLENECKTLYAESCQLTGGVSYIYGSNTWATYQTTGNNFNIDFNTVNKVFIDTGGKLTSRSLGFINNLSTATVTLTSDEVSTLTGINIGSTIQAQINAIPIITNYLQKTGTTTGVNCRFILSASGNFEIYSGSGIIFNVNQNTGLTYIFNLSSTSQINSISTSYFDPTSSIQNQLDSKIAKNGVTNIVIPVLRFTSSSNYFQIQDEKSNELVSFAKLYSTFTKESFFTSDLTSGYGQIKICKGSGKSGILHNNGSDFYILFSDTLSGGYNALRPFYINMTSGLLSSNNSQNFQGLTNLQNIQFSDITSVPNGLTTEVGELINWQINFRATTDRAVVTSTQGIFFRLDNRSGITPFQWYFRAAGSLVETQIMGLSSVGQLTIENRFTCKAPASGVQALVVQTTNVVGGNNGMTLGYELTTNNNAAMFTFNYTSSGSSSNFLGIGMLGFYDRFKLYSNKAIFEDQVTVPTIKVGSGTITGQINPYMLSRTEAYNAMEYGEIMSAVIQNNGISWASGAIFNAWLKKFTDNSTLSFNGTVTCYVNAAGMCYFRIIFTNSLGPVYSFDYGFYFNNTFVHTTIGFAGVVSDTGNNGLGIPALAGVYSVTFQRVSAQLLTDGGDTINCHFAISPNLRGKI